jgi:dihydroxy-acid dehydratase
MDAVICIGGCDKNMPGAMVGMARLNIPGIFVYGGTIKPGHLDGKDLTVVSVFEAVGQFGAGTIDRNQLTEIEKNACPGFGSCGGMYTANTMSSAFEAMGMSLPYSSTMANEDKEKELNTGLCAETLMNMIKHNILPRDIMTRKAFENVIAIITAIAFSKALRVMMSRGRILCFIIFMSVSAHSPVLSSFSLSSFAIVEL